MRLRFPTIGGISKKGWAAFAIYACALSSPWLLDRVATVLDVQPYVLGDPWYRSFWKSDYQYQKITSIGTRTPPQSIVSIVSFAPTHEPEVVFGEANRCIARSFLAKLLVRISEASPKAIVIHRWFGRTNATLCPPEDAGTTELTAAIAQVSRLTPIVIALDSIRFDEAITDCGAGVKIAPEVMILKDRMHFEDGNPDVHYGLSRLNEENKKIPLGWYAYGDCTQARSGKGRQRIPTLALETVSVASHKSVDQILDQSGLQAEYNEIRHPFTHFREEHFEDFSAIDLLCGAKSVENWRTCDPQKANHAALQALRGQIVLVGDEVSEDSQESVFGKLPGTILQAYYLDSLWESRVFKPVPSVIQVFASLCLFLLVEIIFRWQAASPEIAFLCAIFSIAIFIVIVVPIIIGYFHYYPNLIVPGFLALLGKLLQARLEQVYESKKRALASPTAS